MIEVFKTNVENAEHSDLLVRELLYYFPGGNINFDLDDCDRVLRIVADSICRSTVTDVLMRNGYHAEELL